MSVECNSDRKSVEWYVYDLFAQAQGIIDADTDPLREGLIKAIELLEKRLQPERDLPADLCKRYRRLWEDANTAKEIAAGSTRLRTTLKTCRNKKRWALASEILHLKNAIAELVPELREDA
jgi:hypothetical protein